jgi:hypothetical protein
MATVKVTTINVKGASVDLLVSTEGVFQVEVGGDRIEAPTLNDLRKKVEKAVSRAVVPVPIMVKVEPAYYDRLQTTRFEVATLTGIHSATGALLIRHKDGRREQIANYQARPYRLLTKEQQEEYAQLDGARREAAKKLEEWISTYSLGPKDAAKLLSPAKRQIQVQAPTMATDLEPGKGTRARGRK